MYLQTQILSTITRRHCEILEMRKQNWAPQQMLLMYTRLNLLKPTGHVMHQQFNIQQLYVLPTLYLCVLYLSENKQRLVPLTA